MNRSYSKKRHIQEVNRLLENRLLNNKRLIKEGTLSQQQLNQAFAQLADADLKPGEDFEFSNNEGNVSVKSKDDGTACSAVQDPKGFFTNWVNNNTEKVNKILENAKDIPSPEVLIGKFVDFFNQLVSKIMNADFKTLKNLKKTLLKGGDKSGSVNEIAIPSILWGWGSNQIMILGMACPAWLLTTIAVIIITLIVLRILKLIWCAFDIQISVSKGCHASSFNISGCVPT